MTPKFKTRDVSRALFTNYLQRAEECFHSAQTSLKKCEWTGAAINAIHSSISACDAMCVFYLGKRHAGESHNEAIALFKTINNTDEISANAKRLARLLSIKNMAEYEERLVFQKEAESALKDCERFLEFVKKTLKI